MKKVAFLNYVDKANRHYRRLRAKNPGLLPLPPGGGRVLGNGKVELTVENGGRLVYHIAARIEYVAVLEKSFAPPKAVAVPPAVSPADQAKHHVNALLDLACGLENRIARVANVANFTDIAAE